MTKKGNQEDKLLTDNELVKVTGGTGSGSATHHAGCQDCTWTFSSNSQSEVDQAMQQHQTQNAGHRVYAWSEAPYDPNQPINVYPG
ncbi:MAG: hypothetical protein ACM3UW_07640 [Bacillota bacterium]